MTIFPHWLELSHAVQPVKLSMTMLADALDVPLELFQRSEARSGTAIYTLQINGVEAVAVTYPRKGWGTITLKGSYFD